MDKWNGIKTFEWCGYKWIARPLWGINHTGEDFTWYDEEMTSIDNEGNLILNFSKKPRELTTAQGTFIMKPYAMSYCRTTEEFGYGTFEWEMKCPKGKYLWPALWMGSDKTWPPEIDCMEGMSKTSDKYWVKWLKRNVIATMHWLKDGIHVRKQSRKAWVWDLKCGNKFDKYKVVWKPDAVTVYYNNHLIEKYTDKDMLEHFSQHTFHAIMSNCPYMPFSDNDYDEYLKYGSPMVVRKFKYTPM